ncbi:beta-glucosidase BglX [Saccharicrinis fermentans]|uniref:Periplasmic beta-glucosidase n=1 Tax=Saccharicrinis fermentans DSM 9555 = JCM 21142 TaxID=869213 RepID=W7YJV8_9BACT|nr:beta-glucosidase BglX [Saccharicrinis fermentans]GAF04821.1 periplasmic beta-glucosidase precursor [Saccharicrinis fermentans DSM 9555 = JCM 21142]
MKQRVLFFLLILICAAACKSQPKDESEESEFVESLLKEMTLEEKVGQLNQFTSRWEMTGPTPDSENAQRLSELLKSGMVGSMLNVVGAEATRNAQKIVVENSRLGIPLIFGYDVIHGQKTIFPIPLAEAASWDPELARLSASIAAKEAAANGLHWTFAPMVDVGRDARWGRVMEGAGEDSYLGAKFAEARVKGFQGDSLNSVLTVAACAKHFAAYAFSESGRDYNAVDIGGESLHNVVLPPFKAAVDAGVATFMNSFNTIDGLPSTANPYLQRELLKGKWGFDGFVVSDWNSVGEMIAHGAAANLKECAEKAITAGCDMDMEGYAYVDYLTELVNNGEVDVKLINDAVLRILRVKYRLGLFEDPYKYCSEEREKNNIYTKEHLEASRRIARESIVLLKNEKKLLPISNKVKSIAVIGPLADDKDTPLGNWRARAENNSAVSLLEGIKKAVAGDVEVNYTKGCDLAIGGRKFSTYLKVNENDRSGFSEAVRFAAQSDVVVMAIGEDAFMSGEGRSVTDLKLKGLQQELFDQVYKVNKNIIIVLMNGRPLVMPEMVEKAPAMIEAWHLGSQAGNAIADILFGKYNPSGKLPISFPRNVGQVPIYYNHKNTGRPLAKYPEDNLWSNYMDSPNSPQFPFGYGLSFTSFEYADLMMDSREIAQDGKLKVKVVVTNTGAVKGKEVVQLYIRDEVATYARPVKELKGFQKIELEPGESKVVEFELTKKELGYFFPDGTYVVEPGNFKVFVGGNSVDVLEGDFSIV